MDAVLETDAVASPVTPAPAGTPNSTTLKSPERCYAKQPSFLPVPMIALVKPGDNSGPLSPPLGHVKLAEQPGSLPLVVSANTSVSLDPSTSNAAALAGKGSGGGGDDDGSELQLLGSSCVAAATVSSVISSHEASFCNSLMASQGRNLNEMEDCVARAGALRTSYPAVPEFAAVEGLPRFGAHALEAEQADAYEARAGLAAGEAHAEPEPESASPTTPQAGSHEAESCTFATHPRTTSSDAAHSGSDVAGSGGGPRRRRASGLGRPVGMASGDVKTLKELLEWRSHLSSPQRSLDGRGSANSECGHDEGDDEDDADDVVKGTPCSDNSAHEGPLGPIRRSSPAAIGTATSAAAPPAPPAVKQRLVSPAEQRQLPPPALLVRQQSSPRVHSTRGCHVGFRDASLGASSSSHSMTPVAVTTPAEGSGPSALSHFPRGRSSHPSSGGTSQTELADALYAVRTSSNASPSQPRSPAQLEEGSSSSGGGGDSAGAAWYPQVNGFLEQRRRISPQGTPIGLRGGRVTVSDTRVAMRRSERISAVGSPTSVASSPYSEGLGIEDYAPSSGVSGSSHGSPFGPAPYRHGLDRRPATRAGLPPLGPTSTHASGCSRESNEPETGKSPLDAGALSRPLSQPLSRHMSSAYTTPRRGSSPQLHKSHDSSELAGPWNRSGLEEYPSFAVPVDEETNKAVVALVTGLLLAVILGFIYMM